MSVFRHAGPSCVVYGGGLARAGTGRRRLFCSPACRQRAYRLRDEARRARDAMALTADPADVTALLNAVLGLVPRRSPKGSATRYPVVAEEPPPSALFQHCRDATQQAAHARPLPLCPYLGAVLIVSVIGSARNAHSR